ncbi:protein-S-isoprenylcysteine O-methyltransferase-like [Gigantopelta aegis]|uniref:protein-S-isoprenylcysteine O-methyltransferase-like n=1 Tax=Gigantopelta aegis TaxID=1735272 RepID=UPI001B887451|nr:protein-S-isoprenylcysteine O-methyltransferase-like [Gigantopelta aegis]
METSTESRVCLRCFLTGMCILVIPLLIEISFALIIVFTIALNLYLYFSYKYDYELYQIAVRAGCLGLATAVGLLISFSDKSWLHFGWYLTALAFFHWSEYYTTAVTNPKSLTLSSYLLDHSLAYQLAAVSSWFEFFVEWYFFPGLKQLRWVSCFGLVLVIGGEILRKCSMVTASTNFNHYIQHIKKPDHMLVTSGVYSFSRHPSYVGWFYWSVGTQIILCNPICLVAYTVVSWRFFNERIFEEEITLLNFFGKEYVSYQRKVGTGLPFINGYMVYAQHQS